MSSPRRPPGHEPNWLPDPPNNGMILVLRLYGPNQNVVDGTYHYPPIQRVR